MDPLIVIIALLGALVAFGLLVQFATYIAYQTVLTLRERALKRPPRR
jgi:hypothetical protein